MFDNNQKRIEKKVNNLNNQLKFYKRLFFSFLIILLLILIYIKYISQFFK